LELSHPILFMFLCIRDLQLLEYFLCMCIHFFFNPIYDSGLLLKIIFSGPGYFSKIMALDERKSFSKIQTQLFIRHVAKKEISHAINIKKPKNGTDSDYSRIAFKDLIIPRIIRNNSKDIIKIWRLRMTKFSKKFKSNSNP
jgi:hypothetical protein